MGKNDERHATSILNKFKMFSFHSEELEVP